MPRAKKQSTRCTFVQNNRRCPYDGEGMPRLCAAHRLVIQQAAKPRPPSTVLFDAAVNFLQGRPINQEATLGAAEELLSRWTGMGSDYHPPIVGNESEGDAHRRAQSGDPSVVWWTRFQARARQAGRPPAPDPAVAALREHRRAARIVMGFTPLAVLDIDTVKRRHRELVRANHPDHRGRTPEQVSAATKRTAAINNANDILVAEIEGR